MNSWAVCVSHGFIHTLTGISIVALCVHTDTRVCTNIQRTQFSAFNQAGCEKHQNVPAEGKNILMQSDIIKNSHCILKHTHA